MLFPKAAERVALLVSLILGVSGATLFGTRAQPLNRSDRQAVLRSAIAFVSTRHDPSIGPATDPEAALLTAEIYLMDGDGTNPRRLTENTFFDGFPALSPDGSAIVFESNRLRAPGEPFNISDLFLMNTDGSGQTPLVRGSSATWSPDGLKIAFHASASGKGQPIKPDPGAATNDNDIFVLKVGDFFKDRARHWNLTNSPDAIDDDPDWSPDGQKIAFTSHAATDNPVNCFLLPERRPRLRDLRHERGRHGTSAADGECPPRLDALLVTRWQDHRVPPAGRRTRSIPALPDQCGR